VLDAHGEPWVESVKRPVEYHAERASIDIAPDMARPVEKLHMLGREYLKAEMLGLVVDKRAYRPKACAGAEAGCYLGKGRAPPRRSCSARCLRA